MSLRIAKPRTHLRLTVFDCRCAPTIASWVESSQELHWLAPSTLPPLTADKVLAWGRPGGSRFVLSCHGEEQPLGYAELNPMRGETGHLWLGHLILRPEQRGLGTGQVFVRKLLRYAFRRVGANRVSLVVFPENSAAVRCYRRAGFVVQGEEYHCFGEAGRRHKLLRLVSEAPS